MWQIVANAHRRLSETRWVFGNERYGDVAHGGGIGNACSGVVWSHLSESDITGTMQEHSGAEREVVLCTLFLARNARLRIEFREANFPGCQVGQGKSPCLDTISPCEVIDAIRKLTTTNQAGGWIAA